MALRKVKDVIATIKERSRMVHGKAYVGYTAFLGRSVVSGRQVRFYDASKENLIRKINSYYGDKGANEELLAVLTPKQIMDAKMALYALSEAGMDISLYECVKSEIRRSDAVSVKDKKICDAYAEYINTIESGANNKKTQATVGKWVEIVGHEALLSSVTIDSIKAYLKTYYDGLSPITYNSHLSYLCTFFNWCIHPMQRYLPENPAKDIVKKPIAWKRPQYMKPDEVKKIMDILWADREERSDELALAVTQFFVGVRREEAIRIATTQDSATILLEDETFRIEKGKGYTRGRAPRTAHIEPNAMAWMKSFDYIDGLNKVCEATTHKLMRHLERHGITWFRNCARHTFITMHVAKYHMPQVTQSMVGTSGTMRAEHYDGLAPTKEGEEYFNIMPPTSQPLPQQ